MRRRAVLAAALSFAAFFGLAAQHAVGSSKRRPRPVSEPQAVAAKGSTTFFDQRADGYAFDDGAVGGSPSAGDQSASPAPAEQPPPVAQTSVS